MEVMLYIRIKQNIEFSSLFYGMKDDQLISYIFYFNMIFKIHIHKLLLNERLKSIAVL